MSPNGTQRVLILGGGYAGLYTALGLQRHRGETPVQITVVDQSPYMTYQPLLPEVAGGHVAPRDVTVPLHRTLKKSRVIRGTLDSVSLAGRSAVVRSLDGSILELDFDHVVFALGAVTRTFPTPGLKDMGVGFKTMEEAVFARENVLECVAKAAATMDPALRKKLLTFVFVGAGYTGVEAISELRDACMKAADSFPSLNRSDVHWILVEALDRVAPEVGPDLSMWTLGELGRHDIDVRLETTVTSCVDGHIQLSSGDAFDAATLIWTAGVRPSPTLENTDAPLGPRGHVIADTRLRVTRDDGGVIAGAWAVGDNAQVPDLTASKQPAYYTPNAQNALRQAAVAARNILHDIRGEGLEEYRHASLGTIASYGVGDGAALILGVKLKRLPAWLVHRTYHGLVVPTVNRKFRVFAGWIIDALSLREVTSLAALRHPRRAFTSAFPAEKSKK
ncbi:NAD(P)/FAD-dependent oxidoreductase [Leifsonia sp. NPDC058230]|uniref:NAD(P)/FAD-dependent oxidoreductase n=1 Tax=Leifsonia sp. NPDC058230 TaxID=3346391 RepID=UPI0036D8A27B